MSRVTRAGVLVVVAVLVVWLLFAFVFPWVDRTFVSDPTLGLVAVS